MSRWRSNESPGAVPHHGRWHYEEKTDNGIQIPERADSPDKKITKSICGPVMAAGLDSIRFFWLHWPSVSSEGVNKQRHPSVFLAGINAIAGGSVEQRPNYSCLSSSPRPGDLHHSHDTDSRPALTGISHDLQGFRIFLFDLAPQSINLT
jgi:hypothetical protein